MYRNLTKKGVKIPDGFAVTAYAYRHFIKKAKIQSKIKEILSDLRAVGDNNTNVHIDLSPLQKGLNALSNDLQKILSKPEKEIPAPKVNVDVDLQSIEATMLILISEIRNLQDKIQDKPNEWDFEIERSINGRIAGIKAKSK